MRGPPVNMRSVPAAQRWWKLNHLSQIHMEYCNVDHSMVAKLQEV